jgi:signal transduction histidine kinase
MIAAALVYIALSSLLVQPMMRITRNMLHFSQNPEDTSRIIIPSDRKDEIGIAERELAHMQRELSQMLHQKNRLAQLGLAVSKINHDLRNMLASAQLLSDRLGALPDPTVQRFAPKLIASLDRAISFCNDILRFGRAAEAEPRRELMLLRKVVDEVGEGLGLPRDGVAWRIDIDPALRIDADPEHLFRILNNLCRNAAQAIESQRPGANGEILVKAWREGRCAVTEVRDTGPGVPEKARAHLFQAFQGSARKGGTGLGLAIAAELAVAHGGALHLRETETGAAFRLEIPDRRTGAAW